MFSHRRTESINRGTQTPQCSCSKTPVLRRKEGDTKNTEDNSTNTCVEDISTKTTVEDTSTNNTIDGTNADNTNNSVTESPTTEITTTLPHHWAPSNNAKDTSMIYIDDEDMKTDHSDDDELPCHETNKKGPITTDL